jgi:hypothetical protein
MYVGLSGSMLDQWCASRGCSTIIFGCKDGEHLSFSGTYYIPKIKMNILSVGQLDEIGYEILIKYGWMYVRDTERHLLAKIQRAVNRLFVFNTDIAQLVCFLGHAEEEVWRWHARLGHLGEPSLG